MSKNTTPPRDDVGDVETLNDRDVKKGLEDFDEWHSGISVANFLGKRDVRYDHEYEVLNIIHDIQEAFRCYAEIALRVCLKNYQDAKHPVRQAEANRIRERCVSVLDELEQGDRGVLASLPSAGQPRNAQMVDEVAKAKTAALEWVDTELLREKVKTKAEASGSRIWTIAVVALGIIAAAVFLLFVHLLPWKWLVNHPHSYSIQSLGCVVLITAVVGALKPAWRKLLWVAVLLAAGVALLSLLGGPSKPLK